jgi:hypothetical protein
MEWVIWGINLAILYWIVGLIFNGLKGEDGIPPSSSPPPLVRAGKRSSHSSGMNFRKSGYPEIFVGFGLDGLRPAISFSGISCGFVDYYPM